MSKLVLELEYDFDFFLLGVSSHVANYRLAWGMNQQFELDLERVDDIDLSFGPQKKGKFSLYRFDDEESYTTFHLIANRCNFGYFIPELKQIDYFIQYWGPMSNKEMDNFKNELRKIPSVLTAIAINPKELKSRNNLLF
ncbi:MAG: hypothetical protein CMP61_02575 [Flavobacteriales bacterium]|mgnify:CR=1 FL=1|nr:hypothetical protein [Flavobacteriales bacterium]|tara:strand:+ start:949 stop:1365 length:417 start_codon:yes stop_codon:yes gene_type:complete